MRPGSLARVALGASSPEVPFRTRTVTASRAALIPLAFSGGTSLVSPGNVRGIMAATTSSFLRDTLGFLILRSLLWGPRHGYDVMRWIGERSDGVLEIDEGALYPALHRLEGRGLLESSWGRSESKRRAKFYRLTEAGREELARSTEAWKRHARAVGDLLEAEA